MRRPLPNSPRPYLQELEAEAIHALREAAAAFDKPVILYSIGKDSSVLLHLAMKAFYPAKPPFAVLHIDTTWKFREMIAFRDRRMAELGLPLHVHVNREGLARGISPLVHGAAYTDIMKTEALRQALDLHGFDAAIGGARRDEEPSRAKERIFSLRSAAHRWDPRGQRPELWHLYNARLGPGESIRVFPLSNWTEIDVWSYIEREKIPVVPLYFAAPRPVVERNGMLIMRDDERLPLLPTEVPELRSVRFRTLGCYPLTGALEFARRHRGRHHRGAVGGADIGAAGPCDRPGWRRCDGAQEARRLFLMGLTHRPAEDDMLRFITCGSVDDGKSTLIGRLLVDAGVLPDDLLAALTRDGRRYGALGDMPDLALLLDGLQAEREQGITIDVGYRYFSIGRRRFIVADTPGHEQYTRNMATGASTADLAVILVDASKGLLRQTYRHSAIVALMGVRHIVLAVNKMDLVEYRRDRFTEIVEGYTAIAERLGLTKVTAIPVSALLGENVLRRSEAMPWYDGPTLLHHLETVTAEPDEARPFRLAVQWITRDGTGFRGYAGTVLAGSVRAGDEIVVLPSERRAHVARIVTYEGDLERAVAGQAVTLTLAEPVDIGRGDVLSAVGQPPHVSDQFAAHLVWMHESPMLPGRPYVIQLGTATATATVSALKHQLDITTGLQEAAKQLAVNEIGFANLALDRALPFDAYNENRQTGSFILIDRVSNATVGAGMIRFPLRRAANLTWHQFAVDKAARSAIKGHRPAVLWFTGLSGSGKSTVADGVEKRLLSLGHHTYVLDGDNVRQGLNRDLGFTDADRVENIRRVIETAKLMADAGLIVLVSFISPFRAERRLARERLADEGFLEIFVDTPLAECERRDPKGLYAKARAGKLRNFTGVDSAYEAPQEPDLVLRTADLSVEHEVGLVIEELRRRGVVG